MLLLSLALTLIDNDDDDDETTSSSCRLWLQLSGYSDAAAAALSRMPIAPPALQEETAIESSMRADTLLYRVVAGALPDALSDKIRPGLIPFDEEEDHHDNAATTTAAAAVRGWSGRTPSSSSSAEDPPNRDSILQLALLRSAVLGKRLDDTGCVAAVPSGAIIGRPGSTVERMVKLCIGLALREGARSCSDSSHHA